MSSLVEQAVSDYFKALGYPGRVPTAPREEREKLLLDAKRRQVGEAALRFFDAATDPDYSAKFRSKGLRRRKTNFNGGQIIQVHGPFAIERHISSAGEVTVSKIARVYDYRNGATGEGDSRFHIEAEMKGRAGRSRVRSSATSGLADIEINRDDLSATKVEVGGTIRSFWADKALEDPLSPAWDEILIDLYNAHTFVTTGRVAVTSFSNGRIVGATRVPSTRLAS